MNHELLNTFLLLAALLSFGALPACTDTGATQEQAASVSENDSQSKERKGAPMPDKVIKTDEEWRQLLTPEQYEITRNKGTERPFAGKYYNFKGKGVYKCVACGLELFSWDAKFDSGTGWPSYWEPIAKENVREERDLSYGMVRTEVLCSRCDAHLGHIFPDGPPPTGLRYCINSAALQFEERE